MPYGFQYGSSGSRPSGNAVVPANAPIQPPQAYVNLLPNVVSDFDALSWNDAGLTHASAALIGSWFQAAQAIGGLGHILLQNNALPQTDVDGLLNILASSGVAAGYLDISGGTNADPSQGNDNPDLQTLIAAGGWSIHLNIDGVPTFFAG